MAVGRYKIGEIAISRINLLNTIKIIDKALQENRLGYICVTDARTAYLASQDKDYCYIQNNSFLTVPDGSSLVWIAHNKGFNDVDKVSGKDLMDAVFAISRSKNYSHYFFGSTPNTIARLTTSLQKQFPGLDIRASVSPPFQPLDQFDIDDLAKEVNQLKPDFFWCGLGAPKQEQLIAQLQPKLETTICVGVGLAFEYIACTVKRAPKWMQKSGFEWIYRLIQQPQNIKRSLPPLIWMPFHIIFSFFNWL